VSPVKYELGFISKKTPFFIVTAVKILNLTALTGWFCIGDVMCILCGTNWVFISKKTPFFIVTAVKTLNLTALTGWVL
jgi:hypothetical protein